MATITLSAQHVIIACNDTITFIEDKRNREDENDIARVISVKRGWFKRYYPTREQAIKILDSNGMFGWRSTTGGGDLDHARKLLKLAYLGDPVTLNEDDVRAIF